MTRSRSTLTVLGDLKSSQNLQYTIWWKVLQDSRIRRPIECQNKMLTLDRQRDFVENAYLLSKLEESKSTLVYVDEFHVSMKNCSYYNWSKRGEPAWLVADSDPWIMSFVVALSRHEVIGILASEASINSDSFWIFLHDLNSKLAEEGNDKWPPIFVFDNASLHWSRTSIDFYGKHSLRCISITPYSPQLNPAEKIIAVIKSGLRNTFINGRMLSLTMIKTILDKSTLETAAGWVRASQIESLIKMKSFEICSKNLNIQV